MIGVADAFSWLFLTVGALFCVIGGIGLLRLPDFYCRTHAAGITDSLGAGLILVGLAIHAGPTLVAFKLVTVLGLLWITSPASTHALAKAAYARGLKVATGKENDGAGPG